MVSTFVMREEVRGQMRPRFSARGGVVRTYKHPRDMLWETVIRDAYTRQCDAAMHDGEVSIEIYVRRHLPLSIKRPDADTHKPDIDNVAKSVLDALNGVAFVDDRCVTRLVVDKAPRYLDSRDAMVVVVRDVDDGISRGRETLWQRFTSYLTQSDRS